ncbi:MAG: coenzyme F420-0:L-glutamate ligase [Candidatus Berkelbacteria bacterium]|nr:coenzyme F420-0:L-glutamate ligase [Candidatus Berkelbacteria bacterium]
MVRELSVRAVPGIPLVIEGSDLGMLIHEAAKTEGYSVHDNDVLVVAQKIVSKAEGATVNLAQIVPTKHARQLAEQTGRDARLCQVYLDESTEVILVKGKTVVTRHRLGFIGSGSGVDRSNVALHNKEIVVLLPRDPDASARKIRQTIFEKTGAKVAVIINDSMGRSDREGSVGMAIGIAGIRHVENRSQRDLFDNPSNSTIALVDELAATASLLMGQADESIPVVIIRGMNFTQDDDASIQNLLITQTKKEG